MTSRLEPVFGRRTVLCDGAMGTLLMEQGISAEGCDEANRVHPEAVRRIHEEYLRAGAQVVETNTFGGNAFRLSRADSPEGAAEINRAGVRIAREAVRRLGVQKAAWVAGAVGPLGISSERAGRAFRSEARAAFAEQIEALAEGGPGVGVDLLMIETVTALDEAEQAVLAAREVAPELPVMVLVTVTEDGDCLDGSSPEAAARRIASWDVDGMGCNCGFGPGAVLKAIHRMAAATSLPLAALPNAGLPLLVEGRTSYPVAPAEMAEFAARLARAGVQFIGGCCGTTPQHIRAMRSALGLERMEEARIGQF